MLPACTSAKNAAVQTVVDPPKDAMNEKSVWLMLGQGHAEGGCHQLSQLGVIKRRHGPQQESVHATGIQTGIYPGWFYGDPHLLQ